MPTGRAGGPAYTLDSRYCISYWTIELREAIPETGREAMGANVFGCDICQEVCPWNRRAPATADTAFAPRAESSQPSLDKLAALSEAEFREMFHGSPVRRARYEGFLRNVAIAMGNTHNERYRPALERLAATGGALVREHASWALTRIALA